MTGYGPTDIKSTIDLITCFVFRKSVKCEFNKKFLKYLRANNIHLL